MRSWICYILLMTNALLWTQERNTEDLVTIKFTNLSKLEVIQEIEQKTNYHFYFIQDWLADGKKASGDYQQVSLKQILGDLFKDSVINYFINDDKKVVLTLNSVIHDSFPNLVWEGEKDNTSPIIRGDPTPIFYDGNLKDQGDRSNVVSIGKEIKSGGENYYTLKGFARNNTTGESIPSLAIIVKNSKLNAITDDKGYYTIRLPAGVNLIEAKSLGYMDLKKTIIIYNNGEYDFSMMESTELLDELIIEADRDKNIKEAVTGITSIKVQEIKTIPLILGERDILKVATAIPGIKTAGEGSAGFNVRGGKEDQNLILLDNAVLYNPSHFFGIFSAINPFTTGDVDIYKGSIPTEFGGRLSSVFDIKTREGDMEKLAGEASIGPVTSNITLQTPIVKGRSSLIVGGRGTYSNWILRALDDESLNKSSASFYDFNFKYADNLSKKDRMEAAGYYSNDSFSLTNDSLQTYSNRLLSLKWRRQFDEKNYGDLILASSVYKFKLSFDENSINDFDLNYRINETSLKLKFKYLASKKHKFDYGLSGKLFSISPGKIRPKGNQSIIVPSEIANEKGIEAAFFVADNYEINDKLLFNIGLRYSFFAALGPSTQNIFDENAPRSESSIIDTKTYDNLEFIKTFGGPEIRSSLRYSLAPSLSVKASYNNTYQYIHTLSNNTTASPIDTWRLSNLNIKPQQASQYALGLYQNLNGNEYEFSLEGYYKKSKNILDYKVGANLLLNQNIETEILQGKGKAYGVELLLKKNRGRFNGWIGYSYSRSLIKLDSKFNEERVNNGKFFPANFDKPHDLNIIANYKLTKRFSFSANFSYQTGRPVTYPVGSFVFDDVERVLYSDRNKFRIPDYYRVDLGFNVEGNHRIKKLAHSFWNISVYNVLGRNNPYSVFFVSQDGEIKAYKSSIFSIPIPTITYNLKF